MSVVAIPYEGRAWQSWAEELLIAHYGPTEYTKFPDTMGDGGIEGFTSCGHAYQAYGADKTKSGKALHEAQRDKMTEDVKKFIANRAKLAKLFGSVKITRWVLLVPRVGLKELKAHANKMTAMVVAAKLLYVSDDFFVTYCDEESFATERAKIAAFKEKGIRLKAPVPNASELDGWEADNRPLTAKLEDKLTRLEPGSTQERRARIGRSMLSWHLQGRMLMAKLSEISPTIYEDVFEAKTAYEQQLLTHELTAIDARQQLGDVITGFKEALRTAARSIDEPTVSSLASEAVTDWLLRCPLDFRDP